MWVHCGTVSASVPLSVSVYLSVSVRAGLASLWTCFVLARFRHGRPPEDRSFRSLLYPRPVIRRRGTRRRRVGLGVVGFIGTLSRPHCETDSPSDALFLYDVADDVCAYPVVEQSGDVGRGIGQLRRVPPRRCNHPASPLLAAVQWSALSDLTEVHADQRLFRGRSVYWPIGGRRVRSIRLGRRLRAEPRRWQA